MAQKGYSAFGLSPTKVRAIFHPLVEQMAKVEGTTFTAADRRDKFIYYQLADAWTTAESIVILSDAGLQGEPISMAGIEVLTRRLVEQAIVVRYVLAAPDDAVVDSYLKTNAHQWEFSWAVSVDEAVKELPDPQLPPYSNMANDVEPELAEVYKKLSYLSHPRAAFPYALRVRESPLDPLQHFQLDLASMCTFMDIAVRHILFPYRGDPGPSYL